MAPQMMNRTAPNKTRTGGMFFQDSMFYPTEGSSSSRINLNHDKFAGDKKKRGELPVINPPLSGRTVTHVVSHVDKSANVTAPTSFGPLPMLTLYPSDSSKRAPEKGMGVNDIPILIGPRQNAWRSYLLPMPFSALSARNVCSRLSQTQQDTHQGSHSRAKSAEGTNSSGQASPEPGRESSLSRPGPFKLLFEEKRLADLEQEQQFKVASERRKKWEETAAKGRRRAKEHKKQQKEQKRDASDEELNMPFIPESTSHPYIVDTVVSASHHSRPGHLSLRRRVEERRRIRETAELATMHAEAVAQSKTKGKAVQLPVLPVAGAHSPAARSKLSIITTECMHKNASSALMRQQLDSNSSKGTTTSALLLSSLMSENKQQSSTSEERQIAKQAKLDMKNYVNDDNAIPESIKTLNRGLSKELGNALKVSKDAGESEKEKKLWGTADQKRKSVVPSARRISKAKTQGKNALKRMKSTLLNGLPHKLPLAQRLRKLGKLRRASITAADLAMEPVTTSLSDEDKARIDEVFNRYDKDESGALDLSELRDALADLGLVPRSREEKLEFSQILGEVDREGDGELELEEFEELVSQVMRMLRELQRSELFEQFQLHDTDNSGALSIQEVFVILGDLQMAPRTDEERRIIKGIVAMVDADQSNEVDFSEFETLLVHIREHIGRCRRARMRQIVKDYKLTSIQVLAYKNELCELKDMFDHCDKDGSGFLDRREMALLIADVGLGPKSPQEREAMQAMIANEDKDENGQINFCEFLRLIRNLRNLASEKRNAVLRDLFKEYDKDGGGNLSMGECSRMLEHMNMLPRTRAEQREIGTLLEDIDEDGSGELDFSEFANLFQRVNEKLQSMLRKEELETAKSLNMSMYQLEEYRTSFEMIDTSGKGELGLDSIRRMMDILRIPISGDALNELFIEVDEDESGLVEFAEFLQLMAMIETHMQKYGKRKAFGMSNFGKNMKAKMPDPVSEEGGGDE